MNNTTVGFSGRVSWTLIEDGKTVQAGEQSNLITDSGLGNLALYGITPNRSKWKDVLIVGDGTAPPSVSDTALVHAIVPGASNTSGGIPEQFRKISNGVYEWENTRELSESQGNGNLTEFGFATDAANGICIRELFRDANGNPVVLTKTNAQKLRVTHTLRVEIGPVVPVPQNTPMSGDASGDLGGLFCLCDDTNDFQMAYALVSDWLHVPQYLKVETSTFAGTLSYRENNRNYAEFGPRVNVTAPGYTGNLTRTFSCTFDTTEGVGNIRSLLIETYNRNGSPSPGAIWQFAAPFTKDNLHRLSFQDFTLTWGRTPPVSIT